jgi:hypothetical protein
MSVLPKEFQILATREPHELIARLGALVGPASFDLRGRNAELYCRASYLSLGDVGIIHGEYEGGFEAPFSRLQHFRRERFPTQRRR